LKLIDISANKIKEYGLKLILKLGLIENSTLLTIDTRLNPGLTDKLKHHFSLVMLKNIEKIKA
jgi:hypothetical protein